jgi:hypothetical protein
MYFLDFPAVFVTTSVKMILAGKVFVKTFLGELYLFPSADHKGQPAGMIAFYPGMVAVARF